MASKFVEDRSNDSHNLVNGFSKDTCIARQVHLLNEDSTRTGMKEEILRLAWLLVLMRTQEGSQVSFEWAHKQDLQTCKSSNPNRDTIKGLEETVREVLQRTRDPSGPARDDAAPSVSITLSTGSLSQDHETSEDVLHIEVSFEQTSVDAGELRIRPVRRSRNLLDNEVTRYVRSLADTVELCISNPEATIQECLKPTPSDLDEIWGYNHILPPTYDFCMQDMVSERAQQIPEKTAIESWDGTLTFGQIDQNSTFMAHSLIEAGVKPHDIVPLCFEKSRWAMVAVLAVMKAGATFAMMDPSLPVARLQNMAVQIGAKVIVSSRNQFDFSASILPDRDHLVVEEDAFTRVSSTNASTKLSPVDPDTLMYIIFTSGSTGTPKGVTISHKTYTSSAIPRAKAVGYTEKSRVLDFASYAFDVSIDSMLLTVGNGGCLCIPSDDDRLNDINGVIRDMKINYAGITPSMARILDPDVIKSLEILGLGGEAASARDVNSWGQDTRIVIGYGPCECTIGCTINSDTATGRDYISIGTGNGACMWIVHPDDHEQLVPAGAVGELLVEGPIVGQGYLDDPEKTATVFINDPAWLVAGHSHYSGRSGRLYKTGDLGKYDPDGSGGIIFAGRKDTQVKLRGQRVELGEIESQLGARLPSGTTVIAEVIAPQGSGGQATLVAFVATSAAKGHGQTAISSIKLPDDLRAALSEADVDVKNVLPRYMVPTSYIPVNHIPVLISGKTDRKQLKAFGTTVDLREVDEGSGGADRELSEIERRLQQVWGQVLNLEATHIRLEDNFFALGGDSLAAMKLVSTCRSQGLNLSVIDTFGNPALSAMATVAKVGDAQAQKVLQEFSTISRSVDSACLEASQVCKVNPGDVQDIYPCTPTQESLFTFSLKSDEPYLAQRVAVIPPEIHINTLKKAWERVVAANPILRTRAAQLQEPGLQQVVLAEDITWRHATSLEQYLKDDRDERMELGDQLARYAIIDSGDIDKKYMVWSVHHLLYDGWSEPLVLKQVSDALRNQHLEIPASMRDFVEYVRETDETAMQDFWRQELQGAVGLQFPRMPSRDFVPTPDTTVERIIPLETGSGLPFTLATLIRGAWALVASQYSGSDDVLFGETLTGRDIPLSGVESIVGPLIATVPIRVRIDRTSTVESYLKSVQQSILARTPYQHMGWQNIRKVSQDAQHVSEAPTGLVIQPEPEYVGNDLGFKVGDVVREALHFNPYPLMVGCGIRKDGFRVCANFDSSLIDIPQMERILAQLEVACVQLTKDLSRSVSEISCLSEAELNQIWTWNQTPPLAYDESTQRLGAGAKIQQGSVYPPASVAWVCDSRNPSFLSPIGSIGELWLEGSFLSGETVESPAWLLAGSTSHNGRTGRLQATGDLVELRADGNLIFVARKDSFLPIQGHAVDFADLEAHVARYLPPATRGAAAVMPPSSDNNEQVVIFLDQRPSLEDSVDIMPNDHKIHESETTIRANIPVELAVALRKLDKHIHDSLPSYVVPYAYIVLDNLPIIKGQVDHQTLTALASNIPTEIFTQLRGGLQEAWAKYSAQTKLTSKEDVLKTAWANILHISADKIDVDDNFFRLGGDSVLAMKLVSSLRSQGHALSVADIFQNMRLGDAATVLKLDVVSQAKKQMRAYQPYSTLGSSDTETFLSAAIRPRLSQSSWIVCDVLPLTDTQESDLMQTIEAPRTSLQYTTLIFDKGVDSERLLAACHQLVKTHDILRTIFIEHDSTFYQVVVEDLSDVVISQQVEGDVTDYITDYCTADIEQEFALGTSFTKIFHIRGDGDKQGLVLRLSHAQYDGVSLPNLLTNLETLYIGNKISTSPFSTYISATLEPSVQQSSLTYWRNLLSGSLPSVLVSPSSQPNEKGLFKSAAVNMETKPSDVTTANILTTAWAIILARRLQTTDVVFGAVTSGRNIPALANVDDIMGPCYQFTPVRVTLTAEQDTTTLLGHIANQLAESSAHDFIGFSRIADAVGWSDNDDGRGGFDSLVHHQDDEDDVDTMAFAGGVCKVDLIKPHGDSGVPFKVVSFVKGGETYVGVVGVESQSGFVDEVLGQLVGVVGELLEGGNVRVV